MTFEGFTDQDFDLFDLPGFEARMPALRATLTPKLKALGALLTPPLREATGMEFYPHVAMHLRRTVNPPEETWAAFCRSPRAYKPFVHLRTALDGQGVRIVCFLEDDANDKPAFAAALAREAEPLADYLAQHPEIRCFHLADETGEPLGGHALNAPALRYLADRLARLKGQHAAFGICFDRAHPVLASAPEFIEAAVDRMQALLPLYRLGLMEEGEGGDGVKG